VGEHVGTASRMIMRSGKSKIWPLVAPENQGLRKLRKSPKEGKRPRQKKFINSICEEAGHCHVCGERFFSSLDVMNTVDCL
jgi:hypothetical protein